MLPALLPPALTEPSTTLQEEASKRLFHHQHYWSDEPGCTWDCPSLILPSKSMASAPHGPLCLGTVRSPNPHGPAPGSSPRLPLQVVCRCVQRGATALSLTQHCLASCEELLAECIDEEGAAWKARATALHSAATAPKRSIRLDPQFGGTLTDLMDRTMLHYTLNSARALGLI